MLLNRGGNWAGSGRFGTGYFGFEFFRVRADSSSGPFGFGFIRGRANSGSAGSGSSLSIFYIIFYFMLNVIIFT